MLCDFNSAVRVIKSQSQSDFYEYRNFTFVQVVIRQTG